MFIDPQTRVSPMILIDYNKVFFVSSYQTSAVAQTLATIYCVL